MAEYIERKALDKALTVAAANDKDKNRRTWAKAICVLHDLHAADVAPVVRCKDCKHSTLPSELTQRYGKPGTLTCHNMHARGLDLHKLRGVRRLPPSCMAATFLRIRQKKGRRRSRRC